MMPFVIMRIFASQTLRLAIHARSGILAWPLAAMAPKFDPNEVKAAAMPTRAMAWKFSVVASAMRQVVFLRQHRSCKEFAVPAISAS